MPKRYIMPKQGLYDAQGRLTKAGHNYLTGVGEAVSQRTQGLADSAEKVLEPGSNVIQTSGLWETMAPVPQSGADVFTPDLGSRLDFEWTLTGVTTVAAPLNVPAGSLPFFSVLFIQDAIGGRSLSFGETFVGEAVEILDGANDMTLCGFKCLSNGRFTGWAIKNIEFAL